MNIFTLKSYLCFSLTLVAQYIIFNIHNISSIFSRSTPVELLGLGYFFASWPKYLYSSLLNSTMYYGITYIQIKYEIQSFFSAGHTSASGIIRE